MPAKKTAAPRYRPHPMLSVEARALKKLEEETGKSWDQWVALARRKGPKDSSALRAWLAEEHGIEGRRAWWIASGALAKDDLSHDDPEPMVDALYSGSRAPLRALHEKVVDAALGLGDDVLVTACKTMVPIFRKHVFAELRPVDGAVEVQLALGEAPTTSRLERATNRPDGDRLTHRVRLRSASEIDAPFRAWLAQAYGNGAKAMSRGPVDVETPPDLAKALKGSAPARATWESCTPAMRRDLIGWIVSAKRDDTRTKRVGQAAAALAAGKRRVY